jgi:hypothetical protein
LISSKKDFVTKEILTGNIAMVKKILFALGILIGASSFCGNQKKISIYIEEYNYFFTPQKINCLDTLVDKLDDGRTLRIFIYDCKGKMHLECFKGHQKIEEGDYINSLDLLKKYSRAVNAISGRREIIVREYYQPLRSGEWFFYNKNNGKLVDKKRYVQGILQ